MKKILFVVLLFALVLAACMPSQEVIDQIALTAVAQITVVSANTQDVNTIVQATLQSLTLTAQAPQLNVPAGNTGGISGQLSYPSEFIPPQLVVAFNVDTGIYYWVLTELNQTTYQIDNLPVGSYNVLTYLLPDGSLVGAYDQFYLCGLSVECTDYTLIDVPVQAGVVTPNINPGNWYGNAQNYPEIPSIAGAQQEPVFINPIPPPPATGSIAGQLSYPSSFIPGQTVVAFEVNGPAYFFVQTNDGQFNYQIDNIPAGTYYVVAYVGLAAGYSQSVLCGLSVECTDHSLVPVIVTSGQITNNVNPQDWYAPPGSFPDSPLP